MPEPSSLERRWHRLALIGFPMGAVIHLALLVLFAQVGAWPLVWLNCVSVPLYGVCTWMTVRRHTAAAFAVALVEVFAHAVAVTVVIGWDSGFHMAGPIVGSCWAGYGRRLRWLGIGGGVVVWTICYVASSLAPPMIALSPVVLGRLSVASNAAMFIIVIIYVLGFTRIVDAAEAALAREHARSEALVHNMLPSEIAGRLKAGEQNIADRVDEASVLFADLVGFTELSSRTRPAELVVMLSDLFSRFDTLAQKHQLEKIKTIGDAYMVAAGLPRPRVDRAQALADFALEMVQLVDGLDAVQGAKLQLRIGINSGPVVAGVIGKSKLAYDMWGDTVNTAARMESHGVAGRIHVTQAVHDRLGASYQLEPRGTIDVKGKGPMATFFLVGARAA